MRPEDLGASVSDEEFHRMEVCCWRASSVETVATVSMILLLVMIMFLCRNEQALVKDAASKRLEMEDCICIETQAHNFREGEFVIVRTTREDPEPFFVAEVTLTFVQDLL